MARLPWTHFHPESKTLFSVTRCETCDEWIEAPNAVTGHDPVQKYRKLGLKIVEHRYPTGWYDEETGMERCEVCTDTWGFR